MIEFILLRVAALHPARGASRFVMILSTVGAALFSPPARATLGEATATVERDRVALADADGAGRTHVASRATALAHLRPGVVSLSATSAATSPGSSTKASDGDGAGALYEVHETVSDGNTIRQFVDADGTVFAVAWIGIKVPDLQILLGSFHGEFSRLESSQPRVFSRAPKTFRTSQIIVEKGGTLRQKRGRAYLPELVPSGVSLDEIH